MVDEPNTLTVEQVRAMARNAARRYPSETSHVWIRAMYQVEPLLADRELAQRIRWLLSAMLDLTDSPPDPESMVRTVTAAEMKRVGRRHVEAGACIDLTVSWGWIFDRALEDLADRPESWVFRGWREGCDSWWDRVADHGGL